MLRRTTSPLIRLVRQARPRQYSSSPSPPPPPRGSYFSASTIYPFLLLSAITSLALNLSHQRTARSQETSTLLAQISVLESILTKLRNPSSGAIDSEEIERELELVGLGRGKGKKGLGEGELGERKERVSWREVLLGTKDERYREEEDNTDWEKVFREADEASKSPKPLPSEPNTVPTPVLVAPTPTPAALSKPPPPASGIETGGAGGKKKNSTAIYL